MDGKPSKLALFAGLLDDEWPYVHFDARVAGVVVPDHLKDNPHVALQYGRGMPKPIRDLRFDERGISATLTFKGEPSATYVPWGAVYGIGVGDRIRLFEESVPKDVTVLKAMRDDDQTPAPAPRRRHLRSVD
jgi:hypothetical protein